MIKKLTHKQIVSRGFVMIFGKHKKLHHDVDISLIQFLVIIVSALAINKLFIESKLIKLVYQTLC